MSKSIPHRVTLREAVDKRGAKSMSTLKRLIREGLVDAELHGGKQYVHVASLQDTGFWPATSPADPVDDGGEAEVEGGPNAEDKAQLQTLRVKLDATEAELEATKAHLETAQASLRMLESGQEKTLTSQDQLVEVLQDQVAGLTAEKADWKGEKAELEAKLAAALREQSEPEPDRRSWFGLGRKSRSAPVIIEALPAAIPDPIEAVREARQAAGADGGGEVEAEASDQ